MMLQLNSAQRGELTKWLVMYGMDWGSVGSYTIRTEFPHVIWAGPATRKALFYEKDWVPNTQSMSFKLRPEVLEALKDDK